LDKQTVALAIQALEQEKQKIDRAIAELREAMDGRGGSVAPAKSAAVATAAPSRPARQSSGQAKRKGGRRLSAAGRKALSESARRRWATAREKGQTTL
jgi:hypothetical protein